MPKKSNLVNETLMYSINPGRGEVITHHLPFARTSPHLETYLAKGFTFERPPEGELHKAVSPVQLVTPASNGLLCSTCGFVAKTPYGLTVHQRRHKR